jgi:hypothetical protein
MKEPFVLYEASRPGLGPIFSLTGTWGSAAGDGSGVQSAARQPFDASLLHAIFVVHVVTHIWTKEERGNKEMEKTT